MLPSIPGYSRVTSFPQVTSGKLLLNNFYLCCTNSFKSFPFHIGGAGLTLFVVLRKNSIMSLKEALHWRSATKSFNGEKIEQEKLDQILEAIRLAPSSSGLQPYKVFVINSRAIREKLTPIAWGQPQILQASHILVFAAWDELSAERVDGFFTYSNQVRNLPQTTTDDYRLNLLSLLDKKSKEEQFIDASRQSYIALGFGLLAAAELKVDATPMEGFDNAALDELLDLKSHGLRSTVMMALGYRDHENDWWSKLDRVRWPHDELFIEL